MRLKSKHNSDGVHGYQVFQNVSQLLCTCLPPFRNIHVGQIASISTRHGFVIDLIFSVHWHLS